MGRPVPPSDCNCHCKEITDPPVKYCCINGYCVPCSSGPYNEPTCRGNCQPYPPTRYSCIGGYCFPDVNGVYTRPDCNNECSEETRYQCNELGQCVATIDGEYTDPTCNGQCEESKKYDCNEFGQCVEAENGQYSEPTCANECLEVQIRYECNESGECVETEGGQYTDPNCNNECEGENCCEWDGNGATITLQNCDGKDLTLPINCVKISDYVWLCQGQLDCGDSYSLTITCNAEVDYDGPEDCSSKWSISANIPCIENFQINGQCQPCTCDKPPVWCFSGDLSGCQCCDTEDPVCACCIEVVPNLIYQCVNVKQSECAILGGISHCPNTCDLPFICSAPEN